MKHLLMLLALMGSSASLAFADHQVFAHRGASGYLPEHSLPAKAMAYAQGADFLEQDVVLTKDLVPIVLHDIHLDTITDVATRFPERKREDGRFYAIDFTLAEVRELNATQRFHVKTGEAVLPNRFPVDGYTYKLHTLEEEIQFIQGLNHSTGRNVGLFTEIKQPTFHSRNGADIPKVVSEVLARHGYGKSKNDACWVQCFEESTLRRFRNDFHWNGRLMMILSGKDRGADGSDYNYLSTPEGLNELAMFVDGVFPNSGRVVKFDDSGKPVASDFVRQAKAAGLRVISGVIDRDALPKNCRSVGDLHEAMVAVAGVDDLCTDFPDLTVEWLKRNAE
ncbi:glycerophosphodiester phosphodiesterase [Planctomicrobium sp. SH668]|uniref:glycerophosphodiester phosphodiesterase n=1 Tax=Planctomicrobium sp. SH668 TaxID=3448126 RepID=UPI003F5BC019